MEIKSLILEELLTENRVQRVKERFLGNDALIDRLSNEDPSGNNKYLMWMAKMRIDQKATFKDLFPGIELFHNQPHKFEKTDINSYREWSDFLTDFEKAKLKKSRRELRDSGVDKVYEDDDYVVVRPKTRVASCMYGSNTRWCISSHQDSSYFNNYTNQNMFFFIINKTTPATRYNKGAYLKVAVQWEPKSTFFNPGVSKEEFMEYANKRNSYIQFWNASDNDVTPATVAKYLTRGRLTSMLNAMETYIMDYHGKFYDSKLGDRSEEEMNRIQTLKSRKETLINRKAKLSNAIQEINDEIYQTENDINYIKQTITRAIKSMERLGLDPKGREEIMDSLGIREKYEELLIPYNEKQEKLTRLQSLLSSLRSEQMDIDLSLSELNVKISGYVKYRDDS